MVIKAIGNLILVGTSHVSIDSIHEINKAYNLYKPQIIAVELDINRYNSLTSKEKTRISFKEIPRIGFTGFVFAIVGAWLQEKIGNILKIQPGSDMLTAIELSKNQKLLLYLIDQDLNITLRRLSNLVSLKERLSIVVDIIRSIFTRKLGKIDLSKIDLKKVPDQKLIDLFIRTLKQGYPSFYKVLITERNIIISKNLYNILTNNPTKKVLCVVGAGHVSGLLRILKNEKYQV